MASLIIYLFFLTAKSALNTYSKKPEKKLKYPLFFINVTLSQIPLTHFLVFSGNGQVNIIICCSPSFKNHIETKSPSR